VVKRRSLDDALTPEQEEFLRGKARKQSQDPARSAQRKRSQRPKESKPNEENTAMNKPAFKEPPSHPISQQPERLTVPSLVGLNTRIEDQLSDGLLRATLDRRLRRAPSSKVQDIVGEALRDWLKKYGYLN